MTTPTKIYIGAFLIIMILTVIFIFQAFSGRKVAVDQAVLKTKIDMMEQQRKELEDARINLQSKIVALDGQLHGYQRIDSSLSVLVNRQAESVKEIDHRYDKKITTVSNYNSADIQRAYSGFK